MRRTTHLLFLLLCALAVAGPPAAAQSVGPHTIKGIISAPGERPQNIEVVLETGARMPLTRTLADQDGRYAFYGLGFGSYRVVVPAFGGYASVSQEVEIFGSPDAVIIQTVNLNLRPLKGDAQNPPATASVFTQVVPAPAEEEFKKGVKALDGGAKGDGMAHLKRAVEIFPDYYRALARLGTEHARAGQYDKAALLLRRACKVNPHSITSHVMLGISLVELGQYAEALPVLAQSRTLDPKSVNSHLYLGITQFELGELTQAEGSLRRAYELGGPGRAAVAHLHLASLYDRQGKFGPAADALEAYLRDVPKAASAATIRQVVERLRRKAKDGPRGK